MFTFNNLIKMDERLEKIVVGTMVIGLFVILVGIIAAIILVLF